MNKKVNTQKTKEIKQEKKNPTVRMPRLTNSNTFSIADINTSKVGEEFSAMMRKDSDDNARFVQNLFDDLNANS